MHVTVIPHSAGAVTLVLPIRGSCVVAQLPDPKMPPRKLASAVEAMTGRRRWALVAGYDPLRALDVVDPRQLRPLDPTDLSRLELLDSEVLSPSLSDYNVKLAYIGHNSDPESTPEEVLDLLAAVAQTYPVALANGSVVDVDNVLMVDLVWPIVR